MPRTNSISAHLEEVHADWRETREEFSQNIYLKHYWPIPFFGNPRHALVATIGVNPSSGEFARERRWNEVHTTTRWKCRLRDYFNHDIHPHPWFNAWRPVLASLGVSYETGTATHFDVSYRPTKAMFRNLETDHVEFRRMIERDVVWLFKLILLCPRLEMFLTFGPVVSESRSAEPLEYFLQSCAVRHGFQTTSNPAGWLLRHQQSGRELHVKNVDIAFKKSVNSSS